MVAVKVYVVEHVVDAVLMMYASGALALLASAMVFAIGRRPQWFFVLVGSLSVLLTVLVNILPVGMMFVMFCTGMFVVVAVWCMVETAAFAVREVRG